MQVLLFATGALYQLVTDQGFLRVHSVVWEALTCVHGDNEFVNSFFTKSQVSHSAEVETGVGDPTPVAPTDPSEFVIIDSNQVTTLSHSAEFGLDSI